MSHGTKEEKKGKLAYLLATQEFRGLEDIEKAVLLFTKHEASLRVASDLCGVTKGALERAVKAAKDGRDWGVVGRPRHLTLEEETRLAGLVAEADAKQDPLTFNRFQDMVSQFTHTLLLLFFAFIK